MGDPCEGTLHTLLAVCITFSKFGCWCGQIPTITNTNHHQRATTAWFSRSESLRRSCILPYAQIVSLSLGSSRLDPSSFKSLRKTCPHDLCTSCAVLRFVSLLCGCCRKWLSDLLAEVADIESHKSLQAIRSPFHVLHVIVAHVWHMQAAVPRRLSTSLDMWEETTPFHLRLVYHRS